MTTYDAPSQDDTTFEPIPREECLQLIASQSIGRVAVADYGAAPLVVPINFVLDGESVVFRTDYGSKFRLAVLGDHPVSFEVDAVEPGRRTGWSVLVQGAAEEALNAQSQGLGVEPWAPGRKSHWVRIVPVSITGRRIRLPVVSAADGRGYL